MRSWLKRVREPPVRFGRIGVVPGDDASLLARWQTGDRSAGDTLVRHAWPDMLRFFLAATGGDRAMAEDLTQDTFVTALGHRDDMTTTFRAYCYGIARLKRFEAARQRRARARHDDPVANALVLETPESLSEEDRQRSKRAIAVLRRLEPDEQLLLVLKDYLGFTQPELADTFKIPQPRVSGRINRARRRFRREFEALELHPQDYELTLRSLGSALASIVARLPEHLLPEPAPADRGP